MCLPKNIKAVSVQAIAASTASLLYMNFGLIFGISLEHTVLYTSKSTPLNRETPQYDTWVISILFLSASIGSLFPLLIKVMGSKAILQLCGLLQILGWSCIHFAYDIIHIYWSRMFLGCSTGAAFVELPLFVAELSQLQNRNCLILTADKFCSIGIVMGLAMGAYVPYQYVSIIGLLTTFVYNALFPFLQKTPYYYMRRGKVDALEKSLRWYRGIRSLEARQDPAFLQEVQEFKDKMKKKDTDENAMPASYLAKMFMYCLIPALGAPFSGVFLCFSNSSDFFNNLGSVFDNNINCIILGVLYFIGSQIAIIIISRVPRRPFLCATTLISAISLLSLGITTTNMVGYDPWLSLALLSVHLLALHVGIFPFATVLITEIVPLEIRRYVLCACSTLVYLFIFLFIKFFYDMQHIWLIQGWLWFFACSSLVVAAFIFFFLPETHRVASKEIEENMGYVRRSPIP